MIIERIIAILFIIIIVSLFVDQIVVPTIEGTKWFPMFRNKKLKFRSCESIKTDYKEALEAEESAKLEKQLKQQQEKLKNK